MTIRCILKLVIMGSVAACGPGRPPASPGPTAAPTSASTSSSPGAMCPQKTVHADQQAGAHGADHEGGADHEVGADHATAHRDGAVGGEKCSMMTAHGAH